MKSSHGPEGADAAVHGSKTQSRRRYVGTVILQRGCAVCTDNAQPSSYIYQGDETQLSPCNPSLSDGQKSTADRKSSAPPVLPIESGRYTSVQQIITSGTSQPGVLLTASMCTFITGTAQLSLERCRARCTAPLGHAVRPAVPAGPRRSVSERERRSPIVLRVYTSVKDQPFP